MYKKKVTLEAVVTPTLDSRDLVSGARGRLVYELGDPNVRIWSVGVAVGLINDVPTFEAGKVELSRLPPVAKLLNYIYIPRPR